MSRRATLFMEAEPNHNASGFINALVAEGLSQQGFTCEGFYRQRPVPGDALIPLATADRLRRLRSTLPAELAVYCDRGLGISPPSKANARKTAVLFHGLAGAPATWIGNPLIDRYWVLSPYMVEVLTSVLALPDWRQRRCLVPEAFHDVSRLTPALPCVEAPDGDERMEGGELPASLLRALEGGEDVIGHAVQPGKANWQAVCSLLLLLNGMAREHGPGRRFRLVVAAEDFALVAHAFATGSPESEGAREGLEALGLRLEDVLIPVGHLSQRALFQLFRAARFGLVYNDIPESFGFYVLESVFNGCPVYTNGIGNNRHALPHGHGIQVLENVGMSLGDPSAYAEVAERIFTEVLEPHAIQRLQAACLKGREYIQRTFTREAFARDFAESVQRLAELRPPPLPFEELELHPSPLVRLMEEGHVVSDFQDTDLSAEEQGLLDEVKGLRAGQVLARPALVRELEALQGLFSRGVLSLRAPRAASR